MAVQEPDLQHTDETSSTAVLEQEPVAPPPAPASSPMVVFENVTKIYEPDVAALRDVSFADRKSTRLNSSHSQISYAVFCLKKKKSIHTSCPTLSYMSVTATHSQLSPS